MTNKYVFPTTLWVEATKQGSQESGPTQYMGVPLPDEVETIGITADSTVQLELTEEDSSPGSQFIEGRRIEESDESPGERAFKVRYRQDRHPSLSVRLPSAWTNHREETPVYDAEAGDRVFVTIDPDADRFRVYSSEDYRLEVVPRHE